MATSLGQLLDALADHARALDDSPAVRADAATALGHGGRALARLRRDGVSPIAGDQREQRVAALATACTELAARAPATEGHSAGSRPPPPTPSPCCIRTPPWPAAGQPPPPSPKQ